MTTRNIVGVLLAALAFLWGRSASASPPGLEPLAIPAVVDSVAAVPGVPPSPAHPSGTIFLAWVESTDKVVAAEWGIGEQRFLARRVLRSCKSTESCDVRLARSSDWLIALVGGHDMRNDVGLELLSLGLDLSEKKSLVLGAGASPILDADGRFILAGAWEKRPPVAPPIVLRDRRIQPEWVLSLRVLDPSSLQIAGARVLEGDQLLTPSFIGTQVSHAARLSGNVAYVALPYVDDLHVARLKLPSLATESERSFPQ